jgi:hypothetical protein
MHVDSKPTTPALRATPPVARGVLAPKQAQVFTFFKIPAQLLL